MTWGELERLMKRKTNYRFYKQLAGHSQWKDLETGDKVTVGRHKSQEVPPSVLEKILHQIGVK